MLKRFFTVGAILICFFYTSLKAFSADILWRLMHNDQYALVIAQVSEQSDNKIVFEVKQIISGKTVPKQITINGNIKYTFLYIRPNLYDYCVISLDKKSNKYTVKNGIFKADTDDYKKLKFIKDGLDSGIKGDLTAFEYYINSKGKYNNFIFDRGTVYLCLNDQKKIQIYPEQIDKISTSSNEIKIKELEEKISSLEIELNFLRGKVDEQEKYIKMLMQKSYSSKELLEIAKNEWKYRLTINGKDVPKNEVVEVNTSNLEIVLSETQSAYPMLPIEIYNKGALKNYQEHIKIMAPKSIKYDINAASGTIVDSIQYQFKNLKKGTKVQIKITDELKQRLNLKSNMIVINVN